MDLPFHDWVLYGCWMFFMSNKACCKIIQFKVLWSTHASHYIYCTNMVYMASTRMAPICMFTRGTLEVLWHTWGQAMLQSMTRNRQPCMDMKRFAPKPTPPSQLTQLPIQWEEMITTNSRYLPHPNTLLPEYTMVLCLSMLPTPTHKCVYTLPTTADSVAMGTGCLYSLDWTTGLDHCTGLLDIILCKRVFMTS